MAYIVIVCNCHGIVEFIVERTDNNGKPAFVDDIPYENVVGEIVVGRKNGHEVAVLILLCADARFVEEVAEQVCVGIFTIMIASFLG